MFRNGTKVKCISSEHHKRSPCFYPPVGTEGTIIESTNSMYRVQWYGCKLARDGLWWIRHSAVERIKKVYKKKDVA